MRYPWTSIPTIAMLVTAGAALPGRAEMPEPGVQEAAGAAFPFVEAGEGEPVLFVHGSFSDYRAWAGVWDDVARGHHAEAYTQRWFGTTEWPGDKPFSRDVHTADLVAILEARGEPTHLVGWSYGGPIVLRAAAQVPDLVKSVVIYEPTVPEMVSGSPEAEAAREEWFGIWADTDAAVQAHDYDEAVREGIEAAFGLPEGGFEGLDEGARTMILENAPTIPMDWNAPSGAPLLCEELGTIGAPTLLIVGSETPEFWDRGAEAIAACVPKSEIEVIDGVGHGGPKLAQDRFVELTLGFIDAHRGGS